MLASIHAHRWMKPRVRCFAEPYREMVFALLLLFVGAVSVHDAALVVLLEDLIHDFEQNPLGRWLIELAQGGVWLFVLVKLFSTAIVGAAQVMIYQWRPHMALAITTALAGFQLTLLLYLSLG